MLKMRFTLLFFLKPDSKSEYKTTGHSLRVHRNLLCVYNIRKLCFTFHYYRKLVFFTVFTEVNRREKLLLFLARQPNEFQLER